MPVFGNYLLSVDQQTEFLFLITRDSGSYLGLTWGGQGVTSDEGKQPDRSETTAQRKSEQKGQCLYNQEIY